MIIWKPLVGECLERMKEPTNKVDKNDVSLVRTNSHCKGEVVVHVQQKSPWLYPYFYPCPTALWASLQPENTSTIEMNMDWSFLQIYNPYIFMGMKRLSNWLKKENNKDRRKLKRSCKTSFKLKCIQISCKKCLILDVSATEWSILGDNVNWDLKMMSTIQRCPL